MQGHSKYAVASFLLETLLPLTQKIVLIKIWQLTDFLTSLFSQSIIHEVN